MKIPDIDGKMSLFHVNYNLDAIIVLSDQPNLRTIAVISFKNGYIAPKLIAATERQYSFVPLEGVRSMKFGGEFFVQKSDRSIKSLYNVVQETLYVNEEE